MKRDLGDGYEFDERPRTDRPSGAVHRYLSEGSYWARGRSREVSDSVVAGAARVVGPYRNGRQVGFSRTVSGGHVQAYLADVYVLPEARGRGLGVELVRFTVEEGSFARCRWIPNTAHAHGLYRKLGFGAPGERLLGSTWVQRPVVHDHDGRQAQWARGVRPRSPTPAAPSSRSSGSAAKWSSPSARCSRSATR